MNDKDSFSRHGKKAVLRPTDSAKSPPATMPTRSKAKTRTEQLRAKKSEIFQTEMKNLGKLKNTLEKHFTWCHEFSDDETLSKDEKISLFELTILVNETIGHMKILKDAQDECNMSSPYWEDLFETIADHFGEYLQAYIQYVSSLEDMQESVLALKNNINIRTRFNDLSWLGKERCDFDTILTYPRDRIRTLKEIFDEAKTILLNVGEGKSMSEIEKSELHSCNLVLSHINKILATDTSHKSANSSPRRLKLCRVLFSLRPGQDDELRLKENDIIEILSKKGNGWWQGRLREKVGWFPGNYVKELDEDSASDSGSTDSTEKAGSSDEASSSSHQQLSAGKKASNEPQLTRLQRQLSSAEEGRAQAEARVQELILEAQKAKAEAEARAEQLKKVLNSPKVEQKRNSNSSESDSDEDSEDEDVNKNEVKHEDDNDDDDDDDDDDDEVEDEVEDEDEDGNENENDYSDEVDLKRSIKELDEMASLAIGNDSRQKTRKKTNANDDEFEDLECYFCKKVIQTYIPKEGKSYCPSCYEDLFVKKCFKCKKPITGSGLTYKEKPWHSDCFTCTACDIGIAGEKFISRDDKPYCADCFGEKFAKRCTGCTKPIIGDNGMSFISSGGRSWHNECFSCTSCKGSLIGRGFFFTQDDNIVCPGCG